MMQMILFMALWNFDFASLPAPCQYLTLVVAERYHIELIFMDEAKAIAFSRRMKEAQKTLKSWGITLEQRKE